MKDVSWYFVFLLGLRMSLHCCPFNKRSIPLPIKVLKKMCMIASLGLHVVLQKVYRVFFSRNFQSYCRFLLLPWSTLDTSVRNVDIDVDPLLGPSITKVKRKEIAFTYQAQTQNQTRRSKGLTLWLTKNGKVKVNQVHQK